MNAKYLVKYVASSQTFWSRCQRYLLRLFAKLAIRFKWIKQEVYTADELNELLATNFPQTIPLDLSTSDGELILLNAELSMPLAQDQLHIQLYSGFRLMVAGQDIYRAHIVVTGTVTPYYVVDEKSIRIKDMRISDIRLVNDDYAFISSTTDIVTLFMPKAFKYLLLGTVQLTLSVLKGIVPAYLLNYLMLFTHGSKQKVLDYHRADIERLVLKEVEQEDWQYILDETDFEQQLFAELGQEIVVENGQLVFKFYPDE